ncbi:MULTISPECIES: response regulator transcription factor [Campylobacter]|uniref:response regulator transcription factor n=1 Tax=Campylobacter TaxID=194 RepID=UPI0023F4F40D|nr:MULTISPECIES: response regulator transcription factor [Campylobacter]MCI6641128.1 response regulator transcription factor [Campylobacter sp.]MDD7421889.1 response regulator transcription factor [Campylobacter hominis]MDY3117444.1 response regulator transcription factor [Campylobacter hominis]
MKILLLEDDFSYRISVAEYLRSLGYEVDEAGNGEIACNKIAENSYHLLILDVKVPEISGFEVLKYARNIGLKTPTMMMTSLTAIEDLATGYELGCNEYLKKPFNLAELKFRVKELIKKHYANVENFVLVADNFKFYPNERILKFNENEISLSAKELEILEFLLANSYKFVSTEELIDEIWGENGKDIYVRVHIQKIRAKTAKNLIISSRGLGYRINV